MVSYLSSDWHSELKKDPRFEAIIFAETLEGTRPLSMQKKRAASAAALCCVDEEIQ